MANYYEVGSVPVWQCTWSHSGDLSAGDKVKNLFLSIHPLYAELVFSGYVWNIHFKGTNFPTTVHGEEN